MSNERQNKGRETLGKIPNNFFMLIKPWELDKKEERGWERGRNLSDSQIPDPSEEILDHISFLAFKNAQLVFSPQAAGTDLAAWGHAGRGRRRILCRKSSITAPPQDHFITASKQQNYLSEALGLKNKYKHSMDGVPRSQMATVWTLAGSFPASSGSLTSLQTAARRMSAPTKSHRGPNVSLTFLKPLMRDCEEACQCDNNYRNCTIQQLQASHPLPHICGIRKDTQAATLNHSATTTRTFPR